MRLWIFILRATGTAVLFLTILDMITAPMNYPVFRSLSDFVRIFTPTLSHFGIAMLCFGGASALATLRRIDERITRRRMRPAEPEKSIAPDAPAWGELPRPLHRPSTVTESVDAFEERLLRKRLRRFERD